MHHYFESTLNSAFSERNEINASRRIKLVLRLNAEQVLPCLNQLPLTVENLHLLWEAVLQA